MGEAEQLGCGQVLREGISPSRQLRQKCLRWASGEEGPGRGGGGAVTADCTLIPDHRQLIPGDSYKLSLSPHLAPGVGSS